MTSANQMQVGGDHYAQEYQHWDWVVDNCMGYLEGCATKYISRWHKKNGLEDLKKSRHYVDKAIEVANVDYRNHNKSSSTENWIRAVGDTNTYRFIEAGDYDEFQKDLFFRLSEWRTPDNLDMTLRVLDRYIASVQDAHQTQGGAQATLPLPQPGKAPVARPCGGAGRTTPQPPGTSAASEVVVCIVCGGEGIVESSLAGKNDVTIPCPRCNGRGTEDRATMAAVTGSANPEAHNWTDGMEHPFGYDAEEENGYDYGHGP